MMQPAIMKLEEREGIKVLTGGDMEFSYHRNTIQQIKVKLESAKSVPIVVKIQCLPHNLQDSDNVHVHYKSRVYQNTAFIDI